MFCKWFDGNAILHQDNILNACCYSNAFRLHSYLINYCMTMTTSRSRIFCIINISTLRMFTWQLTPMGHLSQNHLQSQGSIWNVVQLVETFDAVRLCLYCKFTVQMEIREGPCRKTGPVTKTSPLVRRELHQAAARKIASWKASHLGPPCPWDSNFMDLRGPYPIELPIWKIDLAELWWLNSNHSKPFGTTSCC